MKTGTQNDFEPSTRDINYMILLHELKTSKVLVVKELSNALLQQSFSVCSKAYVYQIIREMVSFGWVFQINEIGQTKQMAITDKGIHKLTDLISTYTLLLSELIQIGRYLVSELTNKAVVERPSWSEASMKLFKQLVYVRQLSRCFFLTMLNSKSEATASEIQKLIHHRYGWRCEESYIYDIAHEMEKPHAAWIGGRWSSARKHFYYFNLVTRGRDQIAIEQSVAIESINRLQVGSRQLLDLFTSEDLDFN